VAAGKELGKSVRGVQKRVKELDIGLRGQGDMGLHSA